MYTYSLPFYMLSPWLLKRSVSSGEHLFIVSFKLQSTCVRAAECQSPSCNVVNFTKLYHCSAAAWAWGAKCWSHCSFFTDASWSIKADLPVCCHGSCCCWQENSFGLAPLVWKLLGRERTMEGNHRYLNLEGNSHLRVWDRSSSEDICFPWEGKEAKVEVFAKDKWQAVAEASDRWATFWCRNVFSIDSGLVLLNQSTSQVTQHTWWPLQKVEVKFCVFKFSRGSPFTDVAVPLREMSFLMLV